MLRAKNRDPLLQLIRRLSASEGPREWSWDAARKGLWERCARRALRRPPGLREAPPLSGVKATRRPGFAGWLRRFLRRLRLALSRNADARTGRTMPRLLTRAHASLAALNITRLAPRFAPFWNELPASLTAISEQGVVWALAAVHLRTASPAQFGDVVDGLENVQKKAELTIGDCAAIHLLIEDVVASIPSRARLELPEKSTRVVGGLRSPDTLRILPALAAKPDWQNAVERLVRKSPLTQLVYADLLDWKVPPHAGMSALFRPAASAGDDIDLWISHLARSLLAACCSAAQGGEALDAARLAFALSRAGSPGIDGKLPPPQRAQQRMHSAQALCNVQYWRRLIALARIARSCPYFHVRFLDMLVRRIATDCAKAMREWRPDPQTPAEPRTHFFYGKSAACFVRLQTVLWDRAAPVGDRPPILAAWSELRPRTLDVDAIAGTVSSHEHARELIERYTRTGIPLPIPRVQPAHPPQQIWSRWSMDIGNDLGNTREVNA